MAPYCNFLLQNPVRLGCTVDREIVSICNLVDYGATPPPAEYQVYVTQQEFDQCECKVIHQLLHLHAFCSEPNHC